MQSRRLLLAVITLLLAAAGVWSFRKVPVKIAYVGFPMTTIFAITLENIDQATAPMTTLLEQSSAKPRKAMVKGRPSNMTLKPANTSVASLLRWFGAERQSR